MTTILLICHDIPSMTVGATIPIYHLIKQLGEEYDINLVSFDSKQYSIDELKPYLNNFYSLDIPQYPDFKGQFKYTFKNMICPDNLKTRSILNYYYREDMKELINEKSASADIIITDMPMAFYAKNITLPKIVYAFDAVSAYNHSMYLKADTTTSKIYWYLNYLKIHNYEKVYNAFDCCILVNSKDKKLLAEDVDVPIEVVANGVDTDFFRNEDENEDEVKIVFLGDMSTPPNNDAVLYFMEDIYPDILKEEDVDFYIVGRNPSEAIMNLDSNPHVTVTGSVDDVRN